MPLPYCHKQVGKMFSHVSIHPVKSLSQEWVSGTDPFSLRGCSELSSQVKSRLKAFTKPADIRRNSEKEAGKSSILSTSGMQILCSK